MPVRSPDEIVSQLHLPELATVAQRRSTAATKLSRQRNGSRLYRRLATEAKQR
jgi:hypothetical protein